MIYRSEVPRDAERYCRCRVAIMVRSVTVWRVGAMRRIKSHFQKLLVAAGDDGSRENRRSRWRDPRGLVRRPVRLSRRSGAVNGSHRSGRSSLTVCERYCLRRVRPSAGQSQRCGWLSAGEHLRVFLLGSREDLRRLAGKSQERAFQQRHGDLP